MDVRVWVTIPLSAPHIIYYFDVREMREWVTYTTKAESRLLHPKQLNTFNVIEYLAILNNLNDQLFILLFICFILLLTMNSCIYLKGTVCRI